MIWIDAALKAAALASAILATLRASSRATYLLTHNGIGVIDGPSIQKSNETYALFELSQAFKHCVQLSITPRLYQNLQTNVPVKKIIEPYPLSQVPYLEEEISNTASLDSRIQNYSNTISPSSIASANTFATRRRSFFRRQSRRIRGLASMIPTSFSETKQYFTITPKMFSYWGKQAWNLRPMKPRKTRSPVGDSSDTNTVLAELFADDAWDWDRSVKGELCFNATLRKDVDDMESDIETQSRVAELSVFCPGSFQHLRNSIFGISEASFLESMFESGPFVSFQSNSKGAARAGGVFFFTSDGAYMIKTIKSEEVTTFLEMLPKYHKHMAKHGRSSLLTRFCAMYGVRVYKEGAIDKGQLHTFVVMNSVFPAEASQFVSERFDLKGSTVGREVSMEERAKKGRSTVLKDLDLMREVELERIEQRTSRPGVDPQSGVGLNIGKLSKTALLSQLREDVKLLVECQVMDYSLLVGVVQMETPSSKKNAAQHLISSFQEIGRRYANSPRIEERALWTMGAPLRLLGAPPVYLVSQAWKYGKKTFSSIWTRPLPYFGAEECVVDGGSLSILQGNRKGGRAIYYLGLIDFLQPWSTKKVLERKVKGIMGYDTDFISCVSPEEYAERFLEYLDKHIT